MKAKAILEEIVTVMRRVAENHGNFDIQYLLDDYWVTWSKPPKEQDNYQCDAPACIGGWYLLSPEGNARGYHFDIQGLPCYLNEPGGFTTLAEHLVQAYGDQVNIMFHHGALVSETCDFYGVEKLTDITPTIAADRIEQFIKEHHGQ